jgi:hypothetical protein
VLLQNAVLRFVSCVFGIGDTFRMPLDEQKERPAGGFGPFQGFNDPILRARCNPQPLARLIHGLVVCRIDHTLCCPDDRGEEAVRFDNDAVLPVAFRR